MIETTGAATIAQTKSEEPAQSVDTQRQQTQQKNQIDSSEQQQVQSEELLDQIKTLTDDGLYSVRFEQNTDVDELVVKVVDRDTDEVIRQIPPEELLNLSKHLQELRGNIVNTVS